MWPATFARAFKPLIHNFGPIGFAVLLCTVLVLALAPGPAIAQIHLARVLRSALAGAPRTAERIKMGEQLSKIATSVSSVVLALGLIGGITMIGGGLVLVLEGYLEGHLARSATLNAVTLVAGALLTAYFAYLVRLKANQKRATAG
jgi:hypothetical protein